MNNQPILPAKSNRFRFLAKHRVGFGEEKMHEDNESLWVFSVQLMRIAALGLGFLRFFGRNPRNF